VPAAVDAGVTAAGAVLLSLSLLPPLAGEATKRAEGPAGMTQRMAQHMTAVGQSTRWQLQRTTASRCHHPQFVVPMTVFPLCPSNGCQGKPLKGMWLYHSM
jgi:hypothetical protein